MSEGNRDVPKQRQRILIRLGCGLLIVIALLVVGVLWYIDHTVTEFYRNKAERDAGRFSDNAVP